MKREPALRALNRLYDTPEGRQKETRQRRRMEYFTLEILEIYSIGPTSGREIVRENFGRPFTEEPPSEPDAPAVMEVRPETGARCPGLERYELIVGPYKYSLLPVLPATCKR